MTRLAQVCELIVDCEHKTAPILDTGVPSIRTPNIGRGRLLLDGVNRVSEETYAEWTKRVEPRAGDLILAREAPVGNVALIPPGLRLCLGQRTVLIRPDVASIDGSYLLYLMLGSEVQNSFAAVASGATVPHLNLGDIRSLELPRLPPRLTQRKIAAILSAYDELVEKNVRRIRILEQMAQAVHREWFIEFRFPGHERRRFGHSTRSKISAGWKPSTLGAIAEEARCGVSPAEIPRDTPYFGLEHLPRKSITLSDWGTASEVVSTKLTFKKGEILFGKIRPYFHKVGVAPIDGVCSSDAIVIRVLDRSLFSFVVSVVSSEEFVAYATKTSQGTKMPRADWKVLKAFPVVIPPKSLLDRFSALFEPALGLMQNLMFQNRALVPTRDLLLPSLISGEIDVTDLNIAMPEAVA